MIAAAERFATEAERLAGTLFRLHGREPRTGLDCIGLASCALERAGIGTHPPTGYTMRNISIEGHLASAANSGFGPARGDIRRGDIVLVRPGPGQHHLLVALGADRFVHAHAGLRRAVVQRGLSGWPLLRHWRLSDI